ncbi:MAG TPA: nucleotidyltransferase domain-containing protein [Clostridia bacterium]|nr:nucleotidyltransferase domain-containing protein [Clostridia bacterium]
MCYNGFSHTGITSGGGIIMQEIARQYGLKLIVLFGSYGTEHFKAGDSDIDLALLSHTPLTEQQYLALLAAFSRYFGYSKIDLVDLRKASGLLKYQIATQGRLLYEEQEGDFLRYSLYCFRYYYDTAKFRRERQAFLAQQLEELAHEQD